MKNKIELLAPGGDIDSIKAAILAGADAVYCGLDKFNARDRAKNINFENINGILRLAHQHHCEVFLTLNIIILESEFSALIKLLNKLVNTQIDGIIVQDFGLFFLLYNYFPRLKIHASTQLTTHNQGQIKFLNQLNASRVNLSRELNIDEIKDLTSTAHANNMLTEVFVHGSNCISFSGLCYMSSVNSGNSGNRGRCSQPCRDQYLTTAEGKDFPLNIKDNSAFSDLSVLSQIGVDSVKIEGRIKKYHYVYTVVNAWRKQLQKFYQYNKTDHESIALRQVFNRDLSDSFLQGQITRDVFIDNPRDNSAHYFAAKETTQTILNNSSAPIKPVIFKTDSEISASDNTDLTTAKKHLYTIKTEIISDVKTSIDKLSIEKVPLVISFSGAAGEYLKVNVKAKDIDLSLSSSTKLTPAGTAEKKNNKSKYLNYELLLTRFKAINDSQYVIEEFNLNQLESKLIIPFKELTALKKDILYQLNNSIESVDPIEYKSIQNTLTQKTRVNQNGKSEISIIPAQPRLSLLISSIEDLSLCHIDNIDVYFELPNRLQNNTAYFVDLFIAQANKGGTLIPWFSSVLIGEDYHSAVKFLNQVKPKQIVTNNTGIAYEANQLGISWVAGPYLNIVNSFSLHCLKENFNCSGAFISNEINKNQIKRLQAPNNFELFYSIYHPIVLMTSKACFFHQVTGCKKNVVDGTCIEKCEKSSLITNLKDISYLIKKSKGNYHTIYNEKNFLNTRILNDFPGKFSSLFIDLREIATETKVTVSKTDLIALFNHYLRGDSGAAEMLKEHIKHSTDTQYSQGI